MEKKLLVLFYDIKHTTLEEVANTGKILDKGNINYIMLPKYWDYEYMTKEEAITILDAMKTFVKEYFNE